MKEAYNYSWRLFLFILVLSSFSMNAQRGKNHHGHHPHHPGKKVVVKRSPYRPAKVVVFHPVWRPKHAYYRRWVYFPRYNFYWDNWRNHYVFWNGVIWVSQPAPPPSVNSQELEKEKHVELKEENDDVDDVYKDNSTHKEENKPD